MEITTCLWFDGRAREAANFYTSIFPNSSVADNWIAPTDTPGNQQGEEIVVNFKIFGQHFIGLDGPRLADDLRLVCRQKFALHIHQQAGGHANWCCANAYLQFAFAHVGGGLTQNQS